MTVQRLTTFENKRMRTKKKETKLESKSYYLISNFGSGFGNQGGNGLTCRHSLCNPILSNSLIDLVFPQYAKKSDPNNLS